VEEESTARGGTREEQSEESREALMQGGGRVYSLRDSSFARQSSHPDADDPMGAVVVQSRAGQRSRRVPNHFRGRERVKEHS